jgi:proton-dependent oligopeptide transporter, POT family
LSKFSSKCPNSFLAVTNFIQQPLPDGSKTGAAGTHGQAGALGKGQRASTGIGTFNQFWVYFTPLLGAYVADTYLGRYNTILLALAIAIVGHIILTVSAIPTVLSNSSGALACFLIGLIIMGVGTGGFKPNISPLIAEQLPLTRMKVITDKKGERVIVDPAVTASSVYMWFYLFINIGALVGQLSMAYSEKYVGFWLSYFLPTAMLCLCPAVMFACRKVYVRTPPQGSVLGKAMRIFFFAQKGRWSINPVQTYRNMNDGTFWTKVKPSNLSAGQRPKWMTFDDQWVDEVARGFAACSVFLWYPLYWLTYNQLNNNLTSQAAVMTLNGIPNDVLSNLDPFALIILIPICDLLIYPALRRAGINFSPIKKITWGFYTGAAAMIWACVIQAYIYKFSECGRYAAGETALGVPCTPTRINVWAQTGSYVLIAISEILASITSLEYAFTKAPRNMRSLVMAFNLFMNAISAAIGEAFVSLSADPLLVWNYGVMGVLAFIGGTCFWIQYRGLDKQEDELNMLPTGHLGTATEAKELEVERKRSSVQETKDAQ